MSRSLVLKELVETERRAGLWSRRVLGVPVWPLERLHQYRAALMEAENADAENRTNPLGNITRRVRTSLHEFRRGAPPARRDRDIWVLSASNYRRKDESGEYQVTFTEDLRKQLGRRLLFLERNHAALPALDRDDTLYVDAALVAAEAAGRVLGPLLAKTPFGGDARRPGCPASASLLCRDAVYARLLSSLARDWIRRAPPKAVFVLNAYHLFIPFQAAAREVGIPVIEMQHGIIHENHPGYVFDGMPELPHLPDHLIVFGRHFGELLDRESPRWRGRWSVGGHPWLKRKRSGVDALPASAFDSVVLFSQPNTPVRTRFRELGPALRSRLDRKTRVILKPHPREIDFESFYRPCADAGIHLATSRDDAHELLRSCRLAVSVSSTVAIEALAFRCRSAVLPTPFRPEDYQALVAQGALSSPETLEDLVALAELAPPGDGDFELPNRLFGVREPELDFERLIHDLRGGRSSPRSP